jgi:hypothetical protein
VFRSAIRVLVLLSVMAVPAVVADPARAVTVVLRAVDDAHVEDGHRTTNYGSATEMVTDSSPLTRSFLRFEVAPLEGTATRAVLRLHVTDKSVNGPELWRANPFEEESVTWATQPATFTRLADLGSVSAGRWVEFDVGGVISAGGTYSFALLPDSADGTDFLADEASSNRPELVIETTVATTTTTGPSTTTTEPSTTTSTTQTTTTTTEPPPESGRSPVDDASVQQAQPATNFGGATSVGADRDPMTRGLLEFRVPPLSGTVSRAVLRLYVTNKTWDGPELWRTGSFDEDTVTWNSAPSATSQVIDLGGITQGWLEIDVRSAVDTGGGTHAFLVIPDSGDGMAFNSKEASSNRPELVVEAGTPPPPPSGDSFEVALIGDTGYTSSQEDALLRTRSDINRFPLAFTVHDGDIWGGGRSCPESDYLRVRDVFDGFEAPFVYTPGDNEWKDCDTSSPSTKLALIRRLFFPDNLTRGIHRMTVTRQSTYVENARWKKNGVVFATINEPGSSGSSGSLLDANINWLNDAFDEAEETNAAGVMIIWQDNPFRTGSRLIEVLKDRTIDFDRPVVLVHGDTHAFQIDHPWSDVDRFTRVETFGTSSTGDWVRAIIDPKSSEVFSFDTERP